MNHLQNKARLYESYSEDDCELQVAKWQKIQISDPYISRMVEFFKYCFTCQLISTSFFKIMHLLYHKDKKSYVLSLAV